MSRRVVITGVGAVTPLGVGADALFDRWERGECGIEDGVGRCSDFDPTEFMSTKEARRTDRFAQFAIGASEEALQSGGWSEELPCESERIACVIGSGIGGLGSLEDQHSQMLERGPKRVSPLSVPLMMANAASAAVAMRHGFRGQTYGTVSACAASAHAIGVAMRSIQSGDAAAALAGGAEATLTPLATAAFAAMGATSPSGISRPFDRRRDGFVMGEGGAALLLEDAEVAERRGAPVLAELLGYGATSDAYHLTAPEPDGAGAARAIQLALEDAEVRPEEVDYINAHGTSTPLNDRSETVAIKAAFGETAHDVPISSAKSTIGHLLGAAGAAEAVATVETLRRRSAPPTLGYEEPDEELDLDYVPDGARQLPNGDRRLVALSNSFGFGGHNAVLCIASSDVGVEQRGEASIGRRQAGGFGE